MNCFRVISFMPCRSLSLSSFATPVSQPARKQPLRGACLYPGHRVFQSPKCSDAFVISKTSSPPRMMSECRSFQSVIGLLGPSGYPLASLGPHCVRRVCPNRTSISLRCRPVSMTPFYHHRLQSDQRSWIRVPFAFCAHSPRSEVKTPSPMNSTAERDFAGEARGK